MRRHAAAAGLAGRRDRQHLRRHRRGRAPGRPDHPQAPAREPGRPPHRHRLRRADRAASASPTCRRSIASSATPRRCDAAHLSRPEPGRQPARRRQRHHVGARDGARAWSTASARGRAPTCRCRTAATTAAPSALSPMAAGRRARCRRARWWRRCAGWSRPATAEVVLTGVDITDYGAGLPGDMTLGQAGAPHPAARARACRACGCPPSTRSRPTRT